MPSTRIARVRTVRRAFGALCRLADPDFDKDRRQSVEYDFRPEGGQLFTGDPARRGTMTPDPD